MLRLSHHNALEHGYHIIYLNYVNVLDCVGYLPLYCSCGGSRSGVFLDRSRNVLYLATKLCGCSPESPNVAFVCPGLILGSTDEVIPLIDLESLALWWSNWSLPLGYRFSVFRKLPPLKLVL